MKSKIPFRWDIRKEMGFSREHKWPLLIVDSSTETIDTTAQSGRDDIIDYFISQGLMNDIKHHSAYEKQGLEWIQEKAIPTFDLLKTPFTGILAFYMIPNHFRVSQLSATASVLISRYLGKIYRSLHHYIKNIRFRLANRSIVSQRNQIFIDLISEWEHRLDGKHFHGGDGPDAADFRMYSLTKAHYHMNIIKKLIRQIGEIDSPFIIWFRTMNYHCENAYT